MIHHDDEVLVYVFAVEY